MSRGVVGRGVLWNTLEPDGEAWPRGGVCEGCVCAVFPSAAEQRKPTYTL